MSACPYPLNEYISDNSVYTRCLCFFDLLLSRQYPFGYLLGGREFINSFNNFLMNENGIIVKGKEGKVKAKAFVRNHKDKVVSLTDWHVPFHDERIVELELLFCKIEQPKIIVLHELHDFYAVSKYDKDPSRADNLQKEIDIVDRYLARLRAYCPQSRIILLNSNHLDRLRRYLWRQAPELQSLRDLKIERLLQLEKHNIEFKETFTYKKVLFKHGNVVRKFSGYSARGEFEKEGMSGCSGHTHRLGVHFHTDRSGSYVWIESGCGCSLQAEYIEGIANWQHGFSIFAFDKERNHFYPTVVPIINYRLDWGDLTLRG